MYCIVFETTVLICMDCIVLTMMFMLFLSVCSVFYDKFHVQLLQDRLWTYEMRYMYVCMYVCSITNGRKVEVVTSVVCQHHVCINNSDPWFQLSLNAL